MILEVLKKAERPLDVKKIQELAGIAHWSVALNHLLQLLIEGQIAGFKTSKSWIFFLPENLPKTLLEEKLQPKNTLGGTVYGLREVKGES
ncbi:hypothetical protein [Candidatus Hecatella orcuttiae]|uniref:hypothetical protein n=1 Tax=Candidatus Hecatella orcuttiae TaxID=1935119 RepID=UPI00286811C1|nr:hypothetical protein [Candidatus Hecatella orcuttiae]